jgi:hypothetical protein
MATDELWLRQTGESLPAHSAFLIYRDLGTARSLSEAQKIASGRSGGESGGKKNRFESWSARFRWVERARSWDNHLQDERDKIIAEAARNWESRRQERRERNYELATRLADRADAMLAQPLMRSKGKGPNGEIIVEPAGWNQRDIALIAKMSADLAEMAISGHSEDDHRTGRSVDADPNDMSPDEAAVMMRALGEHRLAGEGEKASRERSGPSPRVVG